MPRVPRQLFQKKTKSCPHGFRFDPVSADLHSERFFVKTLCPAFAAASCIVLLAASAPAATVVADAFEDTAYTTFCSAGESIVLASDAAHTEGAKSLGFTYNYSATTAWTKDGRAIKTLATPLDMRGVSSLSYDLNVPVANSSFVFVLTLVDDQGFEVRTVNNTAFSAATTGFQTYTWSFASLEKSRWAASGKAVNLAKIRKIMYRLQNSADFAAAGSFSFKIDNLCMNYQAGLLREEKLDDFESYADSAALAAAWVPRNAATAVTAETAAPYAGTKSLLLTADVAGRWTNYAAEYTLPATRDLSTANYLRLAVRGDAKLAALNPTAHLFLVDTAGNRAVAYVWNWPASAEWSDIYLPFQRDGIEPWSSASVSAYGGSSCWREDAYDAGGWSGNCDLTQIAKLWVSIETQNTGTYPVNGVQIGFDNIVAGTGTGLDTPAALNTALATATAGAVLTMGYTASSFGSDSFLNQSPRMMNWVPGTLVYSDDPESVNTLGVLYKTLLPAGMSRIYLYHQTNIVQNVKVTAVLQNAGSSAAHVTFLKKGFPAPSTNYTNVGKQGLKLFYENTTLPSPITINPGAAALMDSAIDSRSVSRYQCFNSIHDFTSDQPLTFTSLMLGASANTLATWATTARSPDDGFSREGTFPYVGKQNTTPYAYDTAEGIRRVRVADWAANIDPFVEGVDAEDGGLYSRLLGNYGMTYTIRVALRSSDGRKVAVVFTAPDGSCGYGGYLQYQFPDVGGTVVGQLAPTPSTSVSPGQGALCCKLTPTATAQTLRIETSPAGSSCLPFDIEFVPYGLRTDVAEWPLY